MDTAQKIQKDLDRAEQDGDRGALRQMQAFALALLVLVGLLLLASRTILAGQPWSGYLGAFAEAGLVGGLADWFAVVALFRHPMGLKLPHTAIIPTRKDEIGHSIGSFVENHFVTEDAVVEKLRSIDPGARLATWLGREENAKRLGGVAHQMVDKVLDVVDDKQVSALVAGFISKQLQQVDLSRPAAALLDQLVEEGRHQVFLGQLLQWAHESLEDKDKREVATRFIVDTFGIGSPMLAGLVNPALASGLGRLSAKLKEVESDPQHLLRNVFDEQVLQFVARVKTDREWQARLDQARDGMLAAPWTSNLLDGLWLRMKAILKEDLAHRSSTVASATSEAAIKLGRTLAEDASLRDYINRSAEELALGLVRTHRGEVGLFIESQLRKWTKEEMTDRVELAVGRDLQYIRINGTFVGGLAGLVIYSLLHLI